MDLEATLDTEINDDVEFVLHVVNTGTAAVELTFPTGQIADVSVYLENEDDPVWTWSEDRSFTQAIETRTLEAGAAIEQVFEWVDPPPGAYRAEARLEADRAVEAETTLRVSSTGQ